MTYVNDVKAFSVRNKDSTQQKPYTKTNLMTGPVWNLADKLYFKYPITVFN